MTERLSVKAGKENRNHRKISADRGRMSMTGQEARQYLEEIPMWASKKNSLQDIRDFLGRMGNPDRGMEIIHVAGTNGKGSVCSYLSSILIQAGYHTAAFLPPSDLCKRAVPSQWQAGRGKGVSRRV